MTSIEEADGWIGRTAVDNTGEQIGIITQIWVDDASGQPEWASVKGTALRGREALVPLAGTTAHGSGRRFAYSKEEIIDAPHAARDGRLEVQEKEQLTSYYGTPDTKPEGGSGNWTDRLEAASDGATVRDIRDLLGDDHSAPPAQAGGKKGSGRFGRKSPPPAQPAGAKKGGGRFGRKSAPSEPKAKAKAEVKVKRGFRRKGSSSEQQPAEIPMQHDGVSVDH